MIVPDIVSVCLGSASNRLCLLNFIPDQNNLDGQIETIHLCMRNLVPLIVGESFIQFQLANNATPQGDKDYAYAFGSEKRWYDG